MSKKSLPPGQAETAERDRIARAAELARAQAAHEARQAAARSAEQQQAAALQHLLAAGRVLAERGPVGGRSAWRVRAESLVELAFRVHPLRAKMLTWQQLKAAIPEHLLALAQELHAAEVARAQGRDRLPIDLGRYERYAGTALWDAVLPRAVQAHAELQPQADPFEQAVHEYREALAAQQSRARYAGSGGDLRAQIAADEQQQRDAEGRRLLAAARLLSHPGWHDSPFGRAGVLPD